MTHHFSSNNNVVVHKPEPSVQTTEFVKEIGRDDGVIPTLLYDLLVRATPSNRHEARVRDEVLVPFMNECDAHYEIDSVGNLIVRIGENHETMFSCHMDTVHSNPDTLTLLITHNKRNADDNGMIYAATKKEDGTYVPSVLGADDKLGCYTMCCLIKAKVNGLYIFHVGEEAGATGSRHISEKTPDVVNGIKRAVAFDRMGYDDVVAYQGGSATASKAFTTALADQINAGTNTLMKFEGDVRGVFTDTAVYTSLIQECTNISVGYFRQHGVNEHFDAVWFIGIFLPAILEVKWEELPTERPLTAKRTPSYKWQRVDSPAVTNKATTASVVNSSTPWDEIPEWKPEDGILMGATKIGMQRVIYKHLIKSHKGITECANILADLLFDKDNLEKEVADLKSEVGIMERWGAYYH